MTREPTTKQQLLALVALERDAFYGGDPLFHSMGAGQATSPSHRTPHDAAEGPAAAGNAAPGALPVHSLEDAP